MERQVNAFQSSKGKLFSSKREAIKADIADLLENSSPLMSTIKREDAMEAAEIIIKNSYNVTKYLSELKEEEA